MSVKKKWAVLSKIELSPCSKLFNYLWCEKLSVFTPVSTKEQERESLLRDQGGDVVDGGEFQLFISCLCSLSPQPLLLGSYTKDTAKKSHSTEKNNERFVEEH